MPMRVMWLWEGGSGSVDQETVRLLCIAGYVVIGLVALYSALTFVNAIVTVIREASPSKLLQLVNVSAPRPRGYSIKPEIRKFIVLLVVFWVCWHYSGDAGDMLHHLLRVTAYIVEAWVVSVGACIAYIVTMRAGIWWRWTQAVVAQHEKRLAEESQGEACQTASQPRVE